MRWLAGTVFLYGLSVACAEGVTDATDASPGLPDLATPLDDTAEQEEMTAPDEGVVASDRAVASDPRDGTEGVETSMGLDGPAWDDRSVLVDTSLSDGIGDSDASLPFDGLGVDGPTADRAVPDQPPGDLSAPRDTPAAAVCGDGVVDLARGELCDDGNTMERDSCAADCRRVLCTNGVRQFVDPATYTCYWRETSVIARSTAIERCRSAGARLAMFETRQELDAVYPAMGLGGSNRVWIGLQRVGATWTWDNGTPLGYMGFRSGEPSGDGTCAEWGPANSFNDIPCSQNRDFVCERERPGRLR
jgi:cysteine-rich repeat protein